mgnify:CR=1 FL=1
MLIENSILATYGYTCTSSNCVERENAESEGENDMETSVGQLDRSSGWVQYIPRNLDIQSTTSRRYKDPADIDKELGIEMDIFVTGWVFYWAKYFCRPY